MDFIIRKQFISYASNIAAGTVSFTFPSVSLVKRRYIGYQIEYQDLSGVHIGAEEVVSLAGFTMNSLNAVVNVNSKTVSLRGNDVDLIGFSYTGSLPLLFQGSPVVNFQYWYYIFYLEPYFNKGSFKL